MLDVLAVDVGTIVKDGFIVAPALTAIVDLSVFVVDVVASLLVITFTLVRALARSVVPIVGESWFVVDLLGLLEAGKKVTVVAVGISVVVAFTIRKVVVVVCAEVVVVVVVLSVFFVVVCISLVVVVVGTSGVVVVVGTLVVVVVVVVSSSLVVVVVVVVGISVVVVVVVVGSSVVVVVVGKWNISAQE